MQIEGILKKHLLHPLVLFGEKQIYQRRLIVGLKSGPSLEIGGQDLPGLLTNRPLGAHGSPSIKQIQRPLTIPKQKTAVINLVLNGLQQVVIPNGVVTGFGRGASEEQDARFTSDKIRVFGVLEEPGLAFMVPVIDLGAEGEGGIGVERGLVVGIGGVGVGSDLGQDAVGLLNKILVDGVGVGGAEVDADGTTEDEDGNEAAQDGDLDVVEGLLDLASPG
ncbi:hypothetical protein CR513_39351, partial [Mucuna pruriens]